MEYQLYDTVRPWKDGIGLTSLVYTWILTLICNWIAENISRQPSVPVKIPEYLSLFSGQSRLRSSHLDRLSFVSSVLPRGSSSNTLNKSFFYRCHIMWNTLPLEIREIRIPITFKFNLWKLVWEDITNSDIDSSLSEGIT